MIRSLQTAQFRNLQDSQIEFGPGWSLLIGDNGAGKTSVLEAIYLAATSKSFTTHRFAECCANAGPVFSTAIETENHGRVELRLAWSGQEGVRRMVNGSSASMINHLKVQPIVAYSARDTNLLEGEPASRRRFLDSSLINEKPDALVLLARLRRVLDSKRGALAQGQPVDPWNQLLAPLAEQVQRWRKAFIGDLEKRTQHLVTELGLPGSEPQLSYLASTAGRDPWPTNEGPTEELILQSLRQRESEEQACGYPLWGPQRDDWKCTWNQVEVRKRGSRGEKKALTLALFAAVVERLVEAGLKPVLLIDDIDSDLDAQRRLKVCAMVDQLPQVIATSSQSEAWQNGTEGVTHTAVEGMVNGT